MKWLAVLAFFLASEAGAADTKYIWTNPAFQSKPDSCHALDSIPETGLSHALMELIRLDEPDTLDLGQKSLAGPADSVLVSTVDSVWAHVFRLRTVDRAGNESCGWASYLQVTPVSEWPPTIPPGIPGLLAEYFDDVALAQPFGQRVDLEIDFDWNLAAPMPGMGVEQFSARWTGTLTIGTAGVYQFRARVEDAARLWVDGTLVIDSWIIEEERDVLGAVPLAAGSRPFRLDYFANFGDAAMRLFWTPPSGSEAIVPESAFSH